MPLPVIVIGAGFPSLPAQITEATRSGDESIWMVETNSVFHAGMEWLTLGGSALKTSYAASCYWRQQFTAETTESEPLPEVLLCPPVRMKERVR